jgi:HTH-type transcriptional regulator/antitoxin HigA
MDTPETIESPGDLLKKLLAERNWTQEDLAVITGRSRQTINEISTGKSGLTPEMAKVLAAAFGNEPSEWWRLEGEYRLSQLQTSTSEVEKRAALLKLAPIKEMQKRGWLSQDADSETLESELKAFFGVDDLSHDFKIPVSYRRTTTHSHLNNAEKAWVIRAISLAGMLPAPDFREDNLDSVEKELLRLAAKSKAVHRVPELLFDNGIRYVVIEPLTNVKIDGAAFWLDERKPVIAMSIRFDNIGSFWFTLMHEWFHIRHKDAFSLDSDLESTLNTPPDESEARANKKAAESLVSQSEIDSFIKRVAPFYSEPRINNLATRLNIHPGIIVGQLQHRQEIGYNAHRKLMVKVRDLVTETAFTDGWGRPTPITKTVR